MFRVVWRSKSVDHINTEGVVTLIGQVIQFIITQPELMVKVTKAFFVAGPITHKVNGTIDTPLKYLFVTTTKNTAKQHLT